MEKILLGLTIFFFTVTGLFYYFLSSFNAESKRQIFINKIAGVKTERVKATPTVEVTFFPTKAIEQTPTITPTPPEIHFMIPLGKIKINDQEIELFATKNFAKDAVPTMMPPESEYAVVPFADFEIEMKFPYAITPGSAENKFVIANQEYEVKLFSQIGTETGFLHEKFYAEKTGQEMTMIMYEINGQSIIMKREIGYWGGGEQVAVGIGATDEEVKNNVVRFFIE